MLRARRISPRDSRRSGMPLNVDGCEVVLRLTDGVRSARAHASRPEKDPRRSEVPRVALPPRESPIYAPQILLRGPTGRSLNLSDSIVPEALLSDGQEFVRVSRSSVLIQMIARLDEVLTSS